MVSQENSIGKPLAAASWLASHHQAKFPERTAFAKRLASLKPRSIVDLGCASGLWLETLNQFLPTECEFIGIDSDEELLNMAVQRSNFWQRKVSFLQLDLEQEAFRIPPSDLTLAFNIFPYIRNLDSFVNILSQRTPRGTLAIRQYDGASIRFGPMPTSKRQAIEIDLRVATENSQRFYHYDLDRTYSVLRHSPYQQCSYEFELFERFSPFPIDFLPYYEETLLWTYQFLSKKTADYFRTWIDADPLMQNRYFYEVDLVALLS
ncbi:MAG: class I SAM-dependent methyltransferase [Prevotella sp.]|nr:class I SAM-dependent methyltransferase [Prevotella sp.]